MTTKRKPKRLAKHVDSRPTIYHPYWDAKICEHVAQGMSVRRFCQKPSNPNYSTVMRWQRELPEFANNLARAREEGGDADADFVGFVGEEVMYGRLDPAAGRVAIEARKWQAAIRKPKKYGNKVEIGGAGADGAIIVRFAEGDDKLG
jgi:hypothetical protein